MDAAMPLNSVFFREEKSVKAINFSSSTIKAIYNVPNIVVSVILLPVYIILLMPLSNVLLWQAIRNIKKQSFLLKKKVLGLSFDEARIGYSLMCKLVEMQKNVLKEIQPASENILTKGLYNKIVSITNIFQEMQTCISGSLFLKVDVSEPFSEKEIDSYNMLNDVWGDDDDKVYARHTHLCLTRK